MCSSDLSTSFFVCLRKSSINQSFYLKTPIFCRVSLSILWRCGSVRRSQKKVDPSRRNIKMNRNDEVSHVRMPQIERTIKKLNPEKLKTIRTTGGGKTASCRLFRAIRIPGPIRPHRPTHRPVWANKTRKRRQCLLKS